MTENQRAPQDFFPALRQLLSQSPSLQTWRSLRRLLEMWPGGDEKLLGLRYAQQYLEGWDPELRMVYNVVVDAPFWPLARTLDVSYKKDAAHLIESLQEANTLEHIEGLHLRISDWQQLDVELKKKFKSLRNLTLTHCYRLTNITFKQVDLPSLERLTIRKCDQLKSIDGIENFSQIRSLRIDRLLTLKQATFLQHLPNLQSLALVSIPQLQDLYPVSLLQNLQELHLSGFDPIRSLAPLAPLTKLRKLFLSDAKFVKDLEPLEALQQLEALEIRGGQSLTEFDFEKKLPDLQKLVIRCMPRLKEKTLQHAQLETLYMSHLDSLKSLTLAHLPALQDLSIKGAYQLAPAQFHLQEIPNELSHLLLQGKQEPPLRADLHRQREVQSYLQALQRGLPLPASTSTP